VGFVKKWIQGFRQAPAGDVSVLFGLPCRRKTPYPQLESLVEECILAIRDEPPENLKRTPGPKAIQYYLARDPVLQRHTSFLFLSSVFLPRTPQLCLLSTSAMLSTLLSFLSSRMLPSGGHCTRNEHARS
jgi:hypothetical protein